MPDPSVAAGYTLSARLGVFESGSRRGMALLATLRDANGQGPASPWSLTLESSARREIAQLTYDDSSEGSFMAWWWEDVPPETGTYRLRAQGAEGTAEVSLLLFDVAGATPPSPVLSPDGEQLSWAATMEGASYACRVHAGATLWLSTAPSPDSWCPLAGLEDGSYTGTVLSFTADLAGLSASREPRPQLPAKFDVASGWVGFVRGASTPGLQLHAAGGLLNYGTVAGGLALWTSISDAAGAPPTSEFTLELSGPGIALGAPLTATYPVGHAQVLFWSYDLSPRPGRYILTAVNGAIRLSGSFEIGTQERLPLPTDVVVTSPGAGGAQVSWSPVAGARAYRVSAWQAGSESPAAVVWTADPSWRFAPGTFATGRQYDVYVTASDVDMTLAPALQAPMSVSVSESTYTPANFTAL